MSVSFLKIDGVEGESTDARHRGEIDVSSWSFGVSSSGGSHLGGGSGVGRASFSDLAVTKVLDTATPALLLAVANGRHIRTATLTVGAGNPGNPGESAEILVVVLQDVVVTSCLLADASDGERPVENVSLSFGTINLTYQRQQPTGQVMPAGEFAWDLGRNRPL